MTTRAKPKRRTTMAPVTSMDELPTLDEDERAGLLRTLKQAEGEIKAGKSIKFDPKRFKDRLVRTRRGKKP